MINTLTIFIFDASNNMMMVYFQNITLMVPQPFPCVQGLLEEI